MVNISNTLDVLSLCPFNYIYFWVNYEKQEMWNKLNSWWLAAVFSFGNSSLWIYKAYQVFSSFFFNFGHILTQLFLFTISSVINNMENLLVGFDPEKFTLDLNPWKLKCKIFLAKTGKKSTKEHLKISFQFCSLDISPWKVMAVQILLREY